MKVDDEYWQRYELFREWFFGGKGWSNRIKLMGPQQPETRAEKAVYSMAATKDSLYTVGPKGMNKIVNYPHQVLREKMVCHVLGGK
jgi:hypothetical protein